MANTKKPRKPYKPKMIVKPLKMRDEQAFEMPGYAASLVLGTEHLQEQHIYDLLSAADMCRRVAPDGDPILPVAQDMVEAVSEIQQRHQRTQKLGVTGDELRTVKATIGRLIEYLRTVPNIKIARAAHDALTEFNRYGALRV